MQEILGLVRRCVTDYDMIQEGETVAVGVSGGKGSLVTLTALARLSNYYQKTVQGRGHHGRNGVCRGMSFDAVADYCAALGVEYIRANVPIYEIVFFGSVRRKNTLLAVRQAPPRCAFDRDERARHQNDRARPPLRRRGRNTFDESPL